MRSLSDMIWIAVTVLAATSAIHWSLVEWIRLSYDDSGNGKKMLLRLWSAVFWAVLGFMMLVVLARTLWTGA